MAAIKAVCRSVRYEQNDDPQGLTRMLEKQVNQVHCIGIGGIGVSGLAELLHAQGVVVTGSDVMKNQNTQRLENLGVKVFYGHDAHHIGNADCVVYTSAVDKQKNPEYQWAVEKNLMLLSRGQALAQLVNAYQLIAVAGTHGKTTTSGLMAHVLKELGCDPSYAVGGIIKECASPTALGNSPYFVAEVDESDASFLYMRPTFAVITNIDADHLEAYNNNFLELQRSFIRFVQAMAPGGSAFVCIDDPIVAELMPEMPAHTVTYGFDADADVRAEAYHQQGLMSCFTVVLKDSIRLECVTQLPGRHNVENALAVIAIAHQLGLNLQAVCRALRSFPGMGRRFQYHGQCTLSSGRTADIIEDYGHHPREIAATLKAARLTWPKRRIVIVFQPHRYSRTQAHFDDFITVLKAADQVFLLDIYSAGEPQPADNLIARMMELLVQSQVDSVYVPAIEGLSATLSTRLLSNDVVLLQGAGDIGAVASLLCIHPTAEEKT